MLATTVFRMRSSILCWTSTQELWDIDPAGADVSMEKDHVATQPEEEPGILDECTVNNFTTIHMVLVFSIIVLITNMQE